MNLKKLITMAFVIAVIFAMAGCSDINRIDETKPTVVCTGFAQYDWVLNILVDEAEGWNIIRINDKGADMHSYQPSAEDMIIISKADILIYTGGLSEEWIKDAMESQNFKGKAYALLDNCEPICLEEEHGHDEHDHDHENEHAGHSHGEYDEHVWLSLDNAKVFCEDIAGLLKEVKPSEAYSKNCKNYIDELDKLDKQFEEALGSNEEVHEGHSHEEHDHEQAEAIIFADRFPFRYLARDYDLEWYAAFPGCSAETEASFNTLKDLANMVGEKQATAVFVTETGDDSLAKTVIENSGNTNIEIIRVNSMQSISKDEARGYIEIMEENLQALRRGIN